MIKAIQQCYSSNRTEIGNAINPAIEALNKTIDLIGQYNLGLMAISLACAYFHDYNIVLLYGIIGGIFYKQVPEITESVNAIYESCFLVVKPLLDYKIKNYRVLNYPIKGMMGATAIFSYILLKPISLILTEACVCIRFGADLVATSRKIAGLGKRDAFRSRNESVVVV